MPGADYVSKEAKGLAEVNKTPPPRLSVLETVGSFWKLDALSEGERKRKPRGLARQNGVVRQITGVSAEGLDWVRLPDGRRDGRLLIEWPGASRLRVHFGGFDAQGGEVWIRDGNGEALAGPYVDKGPYGDGSFWSDPVGGDRVVVEWAGADGGQPRFVVDRMTYQWLDASYYDSAPCHLDATCYPDWSKESRAVAAMEFVGEDGGAYLCSGALLNTKRSGYGPVFLTANHCVNTEEEARSLVTFWGYESARCGGPGLPRDKSVHISGATLLTTGPMSAGDFTLLKLTKVPDNAYMLGWNAKDPPVGTKTVGIHHPRGDYKRIAFGERLWDSYNIILVDRTLVSETNFHKALQTEGRVEQGSSGSPLINPSREVVGTLSYGPIPPDGFTVCDIRVEAGYGKFSLIYPQVRSYLEEVPPPVVGVKHSLAAFRVENGTAVEPKRQQISVTTDSKSAVNFKIAFGAPWVGAKELFGATSADAPKTIELIPIPGAITKAGKYRTTVTVTVNQMREWSTAPRPVTFDVELEAVFDQPEVRASIEPNPVVEMPENSRGHNFRFTLRLEEQAGFDVRITSLRMDGVDLSNRIVEMLGTDRMPANGAIEKVIEGRLTPSEQERLIEVGGWSPDTRTLWKATAKVRFLPRP
jgi:hypothetical protein